MYAVNLHRDEPYQWCFSTVRLLFTQISECVKAPSIIRLSLELSYMVYVYTCTQGSSLCRLTAVDLIPLHVITTYSILFLLKRHVNKFSPHWKWLNPSHIIVLMLLSFSTLITCSKMLKPSSELHCHNRKAYFWDLLLLHIQQRKSHKNTRNCTKVTPILIFESAFKGSSQEKRLAFQKPCRKQGSQAQKGRNYYNFMCMMVTTVVSTCR